jgi:hypothetical protein
MFDDSQYISYTMQNKTENKDSKENLQSITIENKKEQDYTLTLAKRIDLETCTQDRSGWRIGE